MKFTILHFDELASTNTEAISQARRGADEGLCVVARRQTAGRGRHGRVWVSDANAGLYFSVVLRPRIEMKYAPLITFAAAIAVYESLIKLYGLTPDIKWANDVHVGDRKISGILAEMIDTPNGSAIVVGIGVNLKSSNFPPELRETATSVEQETGRISDAATLLPTLTGFFGESYNVLTGAGGAENIRREWEKRSSYCRGKSIKATLENAVIYGTTDGIEANGALRVRTDGGALEIIQAGEVERLRKVSARQSD